MRFVFSLPCYALGFSPGDLTQLESGCRSLWLSPKRKDFTAEILALQMPGLRFGFILRQFSLSELQFLNISEQDFLRRFGITWKALDW